MDVSKRCAERCKTSVWLNFCHKFIWHRESGSFSPISVREFRCSEADMVLARRGKVEITLIEIIAHLKDYLESSAHVIPSIPLYSADRVDPLETVIKSRPACH